MRIRRYTVVISVDRCAGGKHKTSAPCRNGALHRTCVTRFLRDINRIAVEVLHLHPIGQVHDIGEVRRLSSVFANGPGKQPVIADRRSEECEFAFIHSVAVCVLTDRIVLPTVNSVDVVHSLPRGEHAVVHVRISPRARAVTSVESAVHDQRTVPDRRSLAVAIVVYVAVDDAVPQRRADRGLAPRLASAILDERTYCSTAADAAVPVSETVGHHTIDDVGV